MTQFSFKFDIMKSTAKEVARTMTHIQNVTLNPEVINRNMSFGVFITRDNFEVRGLLNYSYYDNTTDKFALYLLNNLTEPTSALEKQLSWLDANLEFAGAPTLDPPKGEHNTVFAKTVVLRESHPLTEAAWTKYFQHLMDKGKDKAAIGDWFSIINLVGGPDSQINSVPPHAAAYPQRDALWTVLHWVEKSPWTQEAYDFTNSMSDVLRAQMGKQEFSSYVNYVDCSYSAAEAHKYYYGEEVYEGLLKLKNKYDPEHVFWNPQAIGA